MTGPAFRYNPFTNNLDYAEQGNPPTAGDVFGPASSTDNDIAVFDGVTGKIIKDTGISSIAPTFAGNVTSLTRMIVPYDDGAGGAQGMYFSDGRNAFRQVGTGAANFFFGNAGNSTLSGIANTGAGQAALGSLTTGIQNTAMGNGALGSLTSGGGNSAIGYLSGGLMADASNNTMMGYGALGNCISGAGNNAFGFLALQLCTGSNNIALGSNALQPLLNGNFNIAIGNTAGNAYLLNESGNILIGSIGLAGDNGVMRFGNDTFNSCFMAGVAGASVSNSKQVYIDTVTGQLGATALDSQSDTIAIRSTLIDMTQLGTTTLFTPEADFVVTGFTAYAQTISGTVGSPVANFGWTGPTYNDTLTNYVTFSAVQGNYNNLALSGSNVPFVPSGTPFVINVTTADVTATTNIQRIDILGYYLN